MDFITRVTNILVLATHFNHSPKVKQNNVLPHTEKHNYSNVPQLWFCCLQSRGAAGRLQRWTAPRGTGAVTSGSPLAALDLSTQTLCRETDRGTLIFEITWNKFNNIRLYSRHPKSRRGSTVHFNDCGVFLFLYYITRQFMQQNPLNEILATHRNCSFERESSTN